MTSKVALELELEDAEKERERIEKSYKEKMNGCRNIIEALEGRLEQIFKDVRKLTDILATPNMGDEGRKQKLVAIKAWEINHRKLFEELEKEAEPK